MTASHLDAKPSECVAKECDCPKCRRKEADRRESEALTSGFVLGMLGSAVIAAAGKNIFRVLGRVLESTPATPLAPKSPRAKKPKVQRRRT